MDDTYALSLDPPYKGASRASVVPYEVANNGLRRTDAWDGSQSTISETSIAKKREYSLFTKCVAEFLGDFCFVFIGTMQGYSRGPTDGTVHAALAHGFTIFIIVASMGHISGGHFNPAVTWSVVASGKMNPFHLPFYWFAQLLGGFCGCFMACAILTYDEMLQVQAGATLMLKTYAGGVDENAWWQGLLSEAVVTYFLCHTILLTAVDTDKNVLAPLAIGFTLSIDILSTGSITGASMNPARSFGPNLVNQILVKKADRYQFLWTYHYVYWAGPLIGATFAAAIYRLFNGRENRLVR